MPITQQMLPGLLKANAEQGAQNEALSREAALKKYLQGQEPVIAGRKQAAVNAENLKTLQSPGVQDLTNEGGSAAVGDIHLGGNPYAKMAMQGPHQAQTLLKNAQGAYKDINSNLDASKTTLDALNLGNSAGDKAAAISEAKLMLNGGKGIPSIAPMLSGDPTMAGDAQKSLNWLQNTPNIPTLQPAQRDALREMVFARHDQTKQQHQQASQQLMQQGPAIAPQADYTGIINSFVNPAQQKIDSISKMRDDYTAAKSKMPGAPISQPAIANPNPTTLDKLMSLFGKSPQQPAAQAAPAPSGAPMSFDDWKKSNGR